MWYSVTIFCYIIPAWLLQMITSLFEVLYFLQSWFIRKLVSTVSALHGILPALWHTESFEFKFEVHSQPSSIGWTLMISILLSNFIFIYIYFHWMKESFSARTGAHLVYSVFWEFFIFFLHVATRLSCTECARKWSWSAQLRSCQWIPCLARQPPSHP